VTTRPPGSSAGGSVLITARRLFDSRTPQVLADPVVEVADGRIVGVRPDASAARGMDVLDLGDATLLPGLIDVHQQLAFDASSDPVARIQSDDDATLLLRMRLAACGVNSRPCPLFLDEPSPGR